MKLVARFGEPLRGVLLTRDLANLEFHEYRVRRDPGCRVCGAIASSTSR